MSEGSFLRTKYETDNGDVVSVRIQPETLTLTVDGTANAAPTTAFSAGFPSAKVSGGRRTLGINCRKCNLVFNAAPEGYKQDSVISVPVLKQAMEAKIVQGATGTYAGVAITVVSLTRETIK